ncbi:hypothetical protein ACLB2K_027966 [Fragaria x ananassa]
MLDSGMLAEFHGQNRAVQTGLSKSIGVAEFSRYFKEYAAAEEVVRRGAYKEAVRNAQKNKVAAGEEADGKDWEAEESRVVPEEAGRDGGV